MTERVSDITKAGNKFRRKASAAVLGGIPGRRKKTPRYYRKKMKELKHGHF